MDNRINGKIDDILAERGARYGAFTNHAMIAQALKALLRGDAVEVRKIIADEVLMENLEAAWTRLSPDQQESLEMQAHKQARIMNGDPNYSDSWRDIAGYAQLVADRLDGTVR